MKNEKIILFDGVCNLCNGTVQIILKNDPKNQFKFASLQSEYGQEFLKKNKLSSSDFKTFIYSENGKVFTQSTAALRVASQLTGFWSSLKVLLLVPKFIRDGVYAFVSKNRYKWFGKQESCMLPQPEFKGRFLS